MLLKTRLLANRSRKGNKQYSIHLTVLNIKTKLSNHMENFKEKKEHLREFESRHAFKTSSDNLLQTLNS